MARINSSLLFFKIARKLQKCNYFFTSSNFETVLLVIHRAVSSTVPVTAVPGTIQVLLYLKKYLVLLTRYFVPCTDPRYKVQCTWIKSTWYLIRYFVPGTWVRYFVPVRNRYNQVQVKSFLGTFTI